MGGHWGSKLLYGIAGYMTPSVLEELGIGEAIYQFAAQRGGAISGALKSAMDTAYSASGGKTTTGVWVGKAAGLAIVLDNIRKGKGLDNRMAFGIGALADDPAMSNGYSSQGSTRYWSS